MSQGLPISAMAHHVRFLTHMISCPHFVQNSLTLPSLCYAAPTRRCFYVGRVRCNDCETNGLLAFGTSRQLTKCRLKLPMEGPNAFIDFLPV
ncbi:hypothetical protein Agabi119p4_3906 [Agaricus bisporus var. burnettii]|uniref:Uncharacterized protein n=1 Tax=Agaricus bisporus var. burnettii TaxID=192524 RepID=A0A8H7KIF0_AGABI|nr:hypothetical protein Agabi119p4_3906 [Agaricus bisporus var. burnettii]